MIQKPIVGGPSLSENCTDESQKNNCSVEGQAADREAAIAQVYADIRLRHPDFDRLEPVMRQIAEAFQPDWSRIVLTEYLEALYCIVRHADFLAPLRDQILLQEAVPASELKM